MERAFDVDGRLGVGPVDWAPLSVTPFMVLKEERRDV